MGDKAAAVDLASGAIWVLTRTPNLASTGSAFNEPGLVLDEIGPASAGVTGRSVPYAADGWVSGQVSVVHGQVWMAWGFRVARFDPASGGWAGWHVPALTGEDDGLTGHIVAFSVAQDGSVVRVARSGQESLDILDVGSSAWTSQPVPSGGVLGLGSQLIEGQAGSLYAGIYVAKGAPQMWRLGPAGAATDVAPSQRFAISSDGSTLTVARDGTFAWAGGAAATGKLGFAVYPTDAICADAQGAAWLAHGTSVSRITSSGSVSNYGLPAVSTVVGGGLSSAGTRTVTVDPNLQALVADSSGRIWVFTYSAGGTESDYASSYTLSL
jgi:hypothetical protein